MHTRQIIVRKAEPRLFNQGRDLLFETATSAFYSCITWMRSASPTEMIGLVRPRDPE